MRLLNPPTTYVSRGESAGRHGNHASLDGFIFKYPDDAFHKLGIPHEPRIILAAC